MENNFTMSYWAVAFIDLLGQKEAFLQTDCLPNPSDTEALERFHVAVANSLYVVTTFRQLLSTVRDAMARGANDSTSEKSPLRYLQPTDAQRVLTVTARNVRDLRFSDGIVLYTSLAHEPGHNPIMGLYELLITTTMLTLVQLAKGNPIRGGVDVGTGTEFEGQLFGAALVKAYTIESKVAQYPRIVVGGQLVEYLEGALQEPPSKFESRARVAMANYLRRLIAQDTDGQRIVDFVGEAACEMYRDGSPSGSLTSQSVGMFAMAEEFARDSRQKWQESNDGEGPKLFERYSRLVRYLDSRAHRWRP